MLSLVTIAAFRDLPEALLARGALESAGIPCYLANENIVRLDWLLANTVGGVRLQVRAADADLAAEVLGCGIPAVFFTDKGELYLQPSCPECDSLDISYRNQNRRLTFIAWLLLKIPLPFPRRYVWNCRRCGHEWAGEQDAA
jgi:Putative prokaryotic signal transducing protein